MLDDMKLTASEQVQLRGDIIGSDRIRAAERARAADAQPQDAARKAERYCSLSKDLNASSLGAREKSKWLSQVHRGDSESHARALHNCGEYHEAGYAAARAASLQYGRSNLHRIATFESSGNATSEPYKCQTRVNSSPIRSLT